MVFVCNPQEDVIDLVTNISRSPDQLSLSRGGIGQQRSDGHRPPESVRGSGVIRFDPGTQFRCCHPEHESTILQQTNPLHPFILFTPPSPTPTPQSTSPSAIIMSEHPPPNSVPPQDVEEQEPEEDERVKPAEEHVDDGAAGADDDDDDDDDYEDEEDPEVCVKVVLGRDT